MSVFIKIYRIILIYIAESHEYGNIFNRLDLLKMMVKIFDYYSFVEDVTFPEQTNLYESIEKIQTQIDILSQSIFTTITQQKLSLQIQITLFAGLCESPQMLHSLLPKFETEQALELQQIILNTDERKWFLFLSKVNPFLRFWDINQTKTQDKEAFYFNPQFKASFEVITKTIFNNLKNENLIDLKQVSLLSFKTIFQKNSHVIIDWKSSLPLLKSLFIILEDFELIDNRNINEKIVSFFTLQGETISKEKIAKAKDRGKLYGRKLPLPIQNLKNDLVEIGLSFEPKR